MMFARRLALLSLLFAVPVFAQPVPTGTEAGAAPPASVAEPTAAPTPAPEPARQLAPAPRPGTVRVVLTTSAGPITLELEKTRAPVTTANFLRYVDEKRLDGTKFYRALKFPSDTPLGLVQGGVRGAPKRVLPPIAHEPTSKTGLVHDNGAISMARGAPGTAAGDFFIILGGVASLNADAASGGEGYAVFGHVVEGIENVVTILDAPTSPTAGEGAMKGQMIVAPITIVSARRLR